MPLSPPRWNEITPSQFEWERAALAHIRAGLPDCDPYRVWSNFEFVTPEGRVYEVDLAVLSKAGFWLVEIKSRPGVVDGDTASWTWSGPDGRFTDDNPLLLANRKAKALAGLLRRRPAWSKVPAPFVEALVFLSAPGLDCRLQGAARARVCLTDRRPAGGPVVPDEGVLDALINRRGSGLDAAPPVPIDVRTARALERAMQEIGIRPSERRHRIGDYRLGRLLGDGKRYQDRLAEHVSLEGVCCRVRQYLFEKVGTEEERQSLRRAAAREFRILQSLDHPGILAARHYQEHDSGPALLFQYDPDAKRLDHFLTDRGAALTPDLRLGLLRQVADAIRFAHSRRVFHRALSPQSVLVTASGPAMPTARIFNWMVGVREGSGTAGGTVHVQELIEDPSLVYMAPEATQNPAAVGEGADVFSLGALAFHLFSVRPPAESRGELLRRLVEQRGLSLAAVLDGTGPQLEGLIRYSTHPEVSGRLASVADFLELLDAVEDELTAPAEEEVADPLAARRGDRLPGGYVVERELGKGSTGVALLAVRDGREYVLKIAREEADNARLRDEYEVLDRARSEFIVAPRGIAAMGGRTVLVLDKAGDKTLARRIREEGRLTLDQLQSFGEDLLSAVGALERQGLAHRDIKPDNIAVRTGKTARSWCCSTSRWPAPRPTASTWAPRRTWTRSWCSAGRPDGTRPPSDTPPR